MTIKYFQNLEQGTEEWRKARCGLLTASETKLIITPKTLQAANNEKERTHLYELAAQRVNNFVEPTFQSYDMLRGKEEEIVAKAVYSQEFAPITDMGFVTNDRFVFTNADGIQENFTIGCSPDGLVEDDAAGLGGVQMKSRVQKYQFETIIGVIDPEFVIQIQTELLVTERAWWDFCSYSNGMNLFVKRMFPDPKIQKAIEDAAVGFHTRLDANIRVYKSKISDPAARILPVERRLPPGEMQPTE